MTTIVLSSPSAFVASLPYLVGFDPRESLVLVWLREGAIVLTQRADMPRTVGPAWLALLWQHPAAKSSDAIIVAAVSSRSDIASSVHAVIAYARTHGLRVCDAILVHGDEWSSLLCDEASCSCVSGQIVPQEVRTAVAAEFAYRGVAPVASREVLGSEVGATPDAGICLALTKRGIVRPTTSRAIEAWRDRAITEAARWVDVSRSPREPSLAKVIAGVQDVRVRDVILWELVQADEGSLRTALAHWQLATRVSPDSFLASVAVVTAIAAWLLGDGARAAVTLRRCLEADPMHPLAHLIDLALSSGLPPSAWREGTAQVSRAECRYGPQGLAGGREAVL